MGLRDMVVIVDDTPECEARLRLAVGLAGQHGAHLSGLAVWSHPYVPRFVEVQIPKEALVAQQGETCKTLDRMRAAFEASVRQR